MDITLTIKADERLLNAINNLAYAIRPKGVEEAVNRKDTANEEQARKKSMRRTEKPEPKNDIPEPAAVATEPLPTAAPAEYTLEQLSLAGAALMDAGKTNELTALLNDTFGVSTLLELPKERYGDFAAAIRNMGADI